jgi:hypothetical protein
MGIGLFVGFVEFLGRQRAFFIEFKCYLEFVGKRRGFFVIFDPFFLAAQVLDNGFGFLGIVPEVRREGFFFLVRDLNQFGIDVKDTSSALQGALQYL